MRFGMPKRRRRVRQRARTVQPFCRLLNADHGIGNAVRFFRIGKVRHQRHFAHIFQGAQLLPDRMHPLRLKAQSVHAAVYLEIDIQRRVEFCILNRFNLPVAVNAGGQTILIQQRQILGMEEPFQQQNRPFPAAFAQQDSLFQIEQRKTVGGAERAPDTVNTVAVGIRFDYRPDARTRCCPANNLQVFLQGLQIQLSQNRTGHDNSLVMRAVQMLWTRWREP